MTIQSYKIEKYGDADRAQILKVWENSVLASHSFLRPADIETIKKLVHGINFNEFEVFCLKQNEEVAGFIGINGQKIEMLFLSPEYFGKGLGRKLIDFSIKELHTDKVDVNEQNIHAVQFYEKLGFKTYERTGKDDIGLEYPLLRMRLERSTLEH